MQSLFDPKIRNAKYIIIQPNPQTEETVLIPCDNKFEVNGYLLGCSNPQDCIVTKRLTLDVRLKCQKDMDK
jgi:CRISPR/Cas system-associated exonuclease Cas4 (RecB family)